MRKLYVVRKGRGYWDYLPTGDHWTKDLNQAAFLTSLYKAKLIAKRTGGEVCELAPTPVRSEGESK